MLKKSRNSGQEYVSANEKATAAKIMKLSCSEKCRLKCANKITTDEFT